MTYEESAQQPQQTTPPPAPLSQFDFSTMPPPPAVAATPAPVQSYPAPAMPSQGWADANAAQQTPTPAQQASTPARYTTAPRLDKPLRGASFGQAISRFFKNYATFSGRASRSEYWWMVLFNLIIIAVCAALAFAVVGIVLLAIWLIAIFIPSLAITWRRLHDANHSGALSFLFLVPFGDLIIFIFTLMDSNPAGARFDADAHTQPEYAGQPG